MIYKLTRYVPSIMMPVSDDFDWGPFEFKSLEELREISFVKEWLRPQWYLAQSGGNLMVVSEDHVFWWVLANLLQDVDFLPSWDVDRSQKAKKEWERAHPGESYL